MLSSIVMDMGNINVKRIFSKIKRLKCMTITAKFKTNLT